MVKDDIGRAKVWDRGKLSTLTIREEETMTAEAGQNGLQQQIGAGHNGGGSAPGHCGWGEGGDGYEGSIQAMWSNLLYGRFYKKETKCLENMKIVKEVKMSIQFMARTLQPHGNYNL